MGPAHKITHRNPILALPDPHAGTVDLELEAAENIGEEQVLLHTVAAATSGDEFVEDGLRIQRDWIWAGRAVMEGEVLEKN
jgi:hypothetical protein